VQNGHKTQIPVLIFCLALWMVSLSCKASAAYEQMPQTPPIILQRLGVAFLGQDGHKIIGSGCPGVDGKGTIIDYHLIVSNVDESKRVSRILVAGDNSTLTWEWPCSNDWALSAENLGNGNWEIFIAPSLPSRVYTVMFFYEDNTFALGMRAGP
jgi:hypothetical protein